MYEDVRVKYVLSNLYKEYGKSDLHRGSTNNPDSCNTLEICARRRAYRNLPCEDRVRLNKMTEEFCKKTHVGTEAAQSVLMRLGIFLNSCSDKRAL